MDSIIATGRVTRGFIGVEPQEITPELASSFQLPLESGIIMAGVVKDSPADQAGIRPGDILTEIDGKPVHDTADMLNRIARMKPGSKSIFTLLRKKKSVKVEVPITRRPARANESGN